MHIVYKKINKYYLFLQLHKNNEFPNLRTKQSQYQNVYVQALSWLESLVLPNCSLIFPFRCGNAERIVGLLNG